MKTTLFKFLLICLLTGNTNLFSQIPINNKDDWDTIVVGGYPANSTEHFYLRDNIGSPADPVTLMYPGVFSGRIDGDGFKIYIEIDYYSTNVGLFSELTEAHISDLIIDGSIIGRRNSINVGSIAGLVSNTFLRSILNLADVTGEGASSSVGGIAGSINSSSTERCTNNGTITGGQYVAGIYGRVINMSDNSKYLNNAGTIQGNRTHLTENSCIAGIVAYYNTP